MATMDKPALMHKGNETFIFMNASRIQSELMLLLGALGGSKIEPIEPDDVAVYESLSELLLSELPHILPLSLEGFPQHLEFLSLAEKRVLAFRVYQLLRLIRVGSMKAHNNYFAVSSAWNRRWSDLIAGQVLQAQIDVLNAGDYQP